MKIVTVAADALSALRVPQLLHRLRGRKNLCVLAYHGICALDLPFHNWCVVERSDFESHLKYLNAHFDVLPLEQAVAAALSGQLQRPTAAITFDDGYQNNFDVAFPLLQQIQLPATIFLATGFVDSEDTVWDARLFDALSDTPLAEYVFGGRAWPLSGRHDRSRLFNHLKHRLKPLPHDQLLAEVDGIVAGLGRAPDAPIDPKSLFRMLDTNSIKIMMDSGLVTFGGHTVRHAILAPLDDKTQRNEIAGSVDTVSRLTSSPCRLFAYPDGDPHKYDARSIQALAEIGVRFAFTTVEGACSRQASPLEIPRYGIGRGYGNGILALKAHHLTARV